MRLFIPRLYLGSVFAAAVLLSACERVPSEPVQQESPADKVTAATAQGSVAGAQAIVGTIISRHDRAEFDYPDCKSDPCPDIDIQRISTNYPWIDQILDQQIVAFSNIGEEQSAADDSGKPAKQAARTLQQNINAFVKSYDADVQAGARAMSYTMNIEASLLGQKGNVGLFEIDAYFFSGGAHGSSPRRYYNFDLLHKKQLSLADIMISGQQQKLHDVLYSQFVAWLKKDNADVNLAEYEEVWKFFVSDNFTFGKDGLTFLYQQYDIGPYAIGLPEFTVPYSQLKGIIKPEYLVN